MSEETSFRLFWSSAAQKLKAFPTCLDLMWTISRPGPKGNRLIIKAVGCVLRHSTVVIMEELLPRKPLKWASAVSEMIRCCCPRLLTCAVQYDCSHQVAVAPQLFLQFQTVGSLRQMHVAWCSLNHRCEAPHFTGFTLLQKHTSTSRPHKNHWWHLQRENLVGYSYNCDEKL